MAIHWVSQTLDVLEEEIEIVYYIRHNPNAVSSFQVTTEPIALQYRTRTRRFENMDGYLTVIIVFYETDPDIQVTLSWT